MRRERLLLLLLLTPGLRGMSRGRPHGVAGEGDDTEDRRSGEAGGAVFCAASCFLFGFSSFFFFGLPCLIRCVDWCRMCVF
jgi:hypothetical protein